MFTPIKGGMPPSNSGGKAVPSAESLSNRVDHLVKQGDLLDTTNQQHSSEALKDSGLEAPKPVKEATQEIASPIAGIFRTVMKVGNVVKSGSVVGTVEALKMTYNVRAELPGVVAEILAQDGDHIEAGDPIFRVR